MTRWSPPPASVSGQRTGQRRGLGDKASAFLHVFIALCCKATLQTCRSSGALLRKLGNELLLKLFCEGLKILVGESGADDAQALSFVHVQRQLWSCRIWLRWNGLSAEIPEIPWPTLRNVFVVRAESFALQSHANAWCGHKCKFKRHANCGSCATMRSGPAMEEAAAKQLQKKLHAHCIGHVR